MESHRPESSLMDQKIVYAYTLWYGVILNALCDFYAILTTKQRIRMTKRPRQIAPSLLWF